MEPGSSSSSIVTIDVGGTRFASLRSTLARSDSFFSAALSSEREGEREEAFLFVDRDPTHFRFVLNWMRGVRVVHCESICDLLQIRDEADFYCLLDMVSHVDDVLRDLRASRDRYPSVQCSLSRMCTAMSSR